jgi:hypothetical protein
MLFCAPYKNPRRPLREMHPQNFPLGAAGARDAFNRPPGKALYPPTKFSGRDFDRVV